MVCVGEGGCVCHRLAAWKHPGSHPARWAHGERPNLGPRGRVKSITAGLLASGGHESDLQRMPGKARVVQASPAAQSGWGRSSWLQLTHAVQTRAPAARWVNTRPRAEPN